MGDKPMNQNEVDRDERVRIENQKRLLELAGIYKKLSRRDLAEALGRDGSKLVRANGNPKLDYVVRLAEVLDWPVGDVAEAIWGGGAAPPAGDGQQDFEALDEAAMAAHRCGDYARLCELAHRMTAVAAAPDQVALAALREAGGWDGLGRYARLLEAVRRGLQEGPTCPELRLLLQVNFANAHYTLWYLFEARAMARDLIDGFRQIPARTRGARAAEAFAHYILGHTWRRLIAKQPEHAEASARAALDALRESHRLYTELAAEFDHAPWRGIAHTCLGGMLEVEAVLGIRPPHAAVGALAEALEAVRGPEDGLSGDRWSTRRGPRPLYLSLNVRACGMQAICRIQDGIGELVSAGAEAAGPAATSAREQFRSRHRRRKDLAYDCKPPDTRSEECEV